MFLFSRISRCQCNIVSLISIPLSVSYTHLRDGNVFVGAIFDKVAAHHLVGFYIKNTIGDGIGIGEVAPFDLVDIGEVATDVQIGHS